MSFHGSKNRSVVASSATLQELKRRLTAPNLPVDRAFLVVYVLFLCTVDVFGRKIRSS